MARAISCERGEAVSVNTVERTPRSRSNRGPSATPKTIRRIASRVIACIRVWIGNSLCSGQESISAPTISSSTAS